MVEGVLFKFWGDNVDKKRKVQDPRSDNQGELVHMVSLIVGRSRTPALDLPHTGGDLSVLDGLPVKFFLPTSTDVSAVKENLIRIISRTLTQYIVALHPLAKFVPKHILHRYSKEMSEKSEVYTLDVLMKNEAKVDHMVDIMQKLQGYLGKDYSDDKIVLCGGDQLTTERMVGAQRLTRCSKIKQERLELLEPMTEDWHCLVSLLRVNQ